MARESTAREIGGIFPRLAAFVIDVVLVIAIGVLAGKLLAPMFTQLGSWSRLVGYVVFVAYFGVLDHFRGTLGKQLLRLEVRRADGSPQRLDLTLLRAAILFLPFLCGGANPGLVKWNGGVTTTEVAIVYALGGAMPLLWLFGGRSRQSVHDLVCQTYVVRAGASGAVSVKPARRWQGGLMLGWMALILGTMGTLQIDRYTRWPQQEKLETADAAILSLPGVKGTGYTLMSLPPSGPQSPRLVPGASSAMPQLPKALVVSVDLRQLPKAPQALAAKVARTLLADYPPASQESSIQVILAYGYDIGIARSYRAIAADTNTAAAWLGRNAKAPKAAPVAEAESLAQVPSQLAMPHGPSAGPSQSNAWSGQAPVTIKND